jgi:hypothetical protein
MAAPTKITLCFCELDKVATKTIGLVNGQPAVVSDYDVGFEVEPLEIPIASIHDLHAALVQATNHKLAKHIFAIRGEPIPGVTFPTYRRSLPRLNKFTGEPEPPSFRERAGGIPYTMLDFDQVDLGPVDVVHDPESAIRSLITRNLPDFLHRTSVIWQLSSSAGLPGGKVSAHLWFWLQRLVTDAEMRAWARQWNEKSGRTVVDPGVFTAVIPHYISPPIFTDGVADPLPRRMGLLEGGER